MSNNEPSFGKWLSKRLAGSVIVTVLILVGLGIWKKTFPAWTLEKNLETIHVAALCIWVLALTGIWMDWGKKK